MSIGKTRTPSDIKKNADPRVELIDMLAAGTGTARIGHIKTVGRNDDLRIDIKVFHGGIPLNYNSVPLPMYRFDNFS